MEIECQGHPIFPLELIYCYFVRDVRSVERKWHQLFSKLRRHGEWFELGDSEVNRFMAEEIK